MPFSSKIALTAIFCLGVLEIGTGLGRFVTQLQMDPKDPTYTQVPALIMYEVQQSIGISVACLCVCRPLLEKVLPRNWRQTHTSDRQRDDNVRLVSAKIAPSFFTAGVRGGSDESGFALAPLEGCVTVRNEVTVTASTAGPKIKRPISTYCYSRH